MYMYMVVERRALTNCDLFVLTKDDLDEVLLSFPLIRQRIAAHAQNEIIKAKQIEIVAKTLDQVRRSTRGRGSIVAENLCSDPPEKPDQRYQRRSKVGVFCLPAVLQHVQEFRYSCACDRFRSDDARRSMIT